MGCDSAGGKERFDSKDLTVRSDAAADIFNESGNMRPRRVRIEHGREVAEICPFRQFGTRRNKHEELVYPVLR